MRLNFFILIFSTVLFLGCSSSKEVSQKAAKKNNKVALSELPEKDQIQFKFVFHNANKERILGNYQLAANLFSQCTRIAPMESAPYFELATIFDLSKEKNGALGYAAKAVELDPDNYWYRVVYAQSLQKTGDTENAIKQYNELIKQNPKNVDLYFDLAGIQLYSKKYEEAIENFDKIEEIVGVNEEISIQKEKIYLKLGDVDKAAGEIQQLINAYPDEIMYKVLLADLYIANEIPEKAFDIYQEILKKDPNNAYVNLSLYDYYKVKKEDKKALESAKKAFASNILDIDTKMQVLLSYYPSTKTDMTLKKEVFELNKILISTHPDEAKAYTIYADFLYQAKELELARDNYLKATTLDNSKFAIWSQLLFIESELQDYDGMLRDSKKALELFPNQSLFYFFYGATNLQKKEYEEAAEYLLIGKDFVIDNPELLGQFYSNLGDAYNGLKEYEKSDEAYENALKIDDKNIYVLNNYGYYLSLRGKKLERAAELSALCNKIEPNQSNYEDTYAWILYKQGKYLEAEEWLKKALKNGGQSNPVILEHIGDVYAQLKNLEKALEYWILAKEKGAKTEFLDRKIADKKLYE